MKIEIKPGDQSWVGKKIRGKDWPKGNYVFLLFVGLSKIFVRADDGTEWERAYNLFKEGSTITIEWELYQEPKPKRLLAPALYQEIDRDGCAWFVSHMLYSSLEEAKRDLDQHSNVRWPAIPNAQGYYEDDQ